MPVAENIYRVLWKKLSPRTAFKNIEDSLV